MPFCNNILHSEAIFSFIVAVLVQSRNCGFACLSNPCIHGVCLDDLNTNYSCYCIDGYTGVQCQTNWDECWSSPCQNGGVCIDGIASFNCSCQAGYVGDLCEEDYNECESNPCLNNGSCTDNLNSYICTCLPGYSGTHCEIDIAVCNATNDTRCSNGGVCIEGPGASFTCKCPPGWNGDLCNSELDECLSGPCQNGAVCIDMHADYACACLFGYAGKNCEETVLMCEINPCKNGAICLTEDNEATCYCVPDYHGDLCQYQYDECQLGSRCMNGGTCIDGIDNFTCSCPPYLTGVLCECLIIGENNFDCTYISSTLFTVSETGTKEISKILSTTEEILETTYSTKVPNLYSEVSPQLGTFSTSPSTEFSYHYSLSTIFITKPEPSTFVTGESSEISTSILSTGKKLPTSVKPDEKEMTTYQLINISTIELPETSTELIQNNFSGFTEQRLDTSELVTSTPTVMYTSFQNEISSPITPQSTQFPTFSPLMSSTPKITSSLPLTDSTLLPREMNVTATEEITKPKVTEITGIEIMPSFFPPTKYEPYTETTINQTLMSTLEENTVTMFIADCSFHDSKCQNGGTCVYTGVEYICHCPFDTEGLFCEIKLGIRNAAFSGDSLLSYHILNYSKLSIELEAKTLSLSGLIFYSNIDSTYMMLYIKNGYLQFRFSCGFQTMLLSELNVPVNNGFTMKIRAELEFSKDFKHCDASINVNNTLIMTGDQVSVINKFVKHVSWLYLGSIPYEHIREDFPKSGFIGWQSVHIFKDAEHGYGIKECSSLACLSNPCSNGGTCTTKDDVWICHCRNGFVGNMCQNSICNNNPCLFGATCVPFTGSGYVCLCPFGKHGHFCENDLQITEPNFSSSIQGLSSYAAYPIPEGISKNMELKFKFVPSTLDQISILMFIGQKGFHDTYSDHIAVSFVKGFIMLTWNLGSGPRRIFTTSPISNNKTSHLVKLGYTGRRAWLFVEDLGNVTGRSPGNLMHLDIYPLLYLGGHHDKNFSTLPHDLPLHTGFSGCIYDVELKSGSVIMPIQTSRQVIGRAVGQCGTTECYERVCQNDGACLHHGSTFMCLCQDGTFGPLCSSKYSLCDSMRHNCTFGSTCVPVISNYECDCPVGKTGRFCEIEETLSDVKFSGKRSFLSIEFADFDSKKFNIEFELRILNNLGLVFYMGNKDINFFALSLQSGLLEITILSGKKTVTVNEVLRIRSNKLLAMGTWYKVQCGVYGRKIYLGVNNVMNTGLLNSNETLSIIGKTLFFGGIPDLSTLPQNIISTFPVSFTGCIRNVFLNTQHIPLNQATIKDGRNIADCDGTPCGADACENGGTCWLDPNLNPHCICLEPYYGSRCENTPVCDKIMCKNNGRCINSKCSCSLGWSGAFCETKINVKTPKFKGKSYLIIKKMNDKKRDLNDFLVENIYLNFTTVQLDGLLLWSEKGKSFIGIGISKGYLKVVYSFGKINQKVVEMPNFGFISDGLWHTKERIKDTNGFISTDGIFYLGGITTNYSVTLGTNGLFHNEFEGCIETLHVNEKLITNFAKYEGENVDTCNII